MRSLDARSRPWLVKEALEHVKTKSRQWCCALTNKQCLGQLLTSKPMTKPRPKFLNWIEVRTPCRDGPETDAESPISPASKVCLQKALVVGKHEPRPSRAHWTASLDGISELACIQALDPLVRSELVPLMPENWRKSACAAPSPKRDGTRLRHLFAVLVAACELRGHSLRG